MSDIQNGYWRAKAISADLGTTSKGTDQVAMLVEFIGGDNHGQRMTWYGYFSEKAADRTIESLMIAGWDGNDLYDLKGLGSTEFEVVVGDDNYDGKPRKRINWINRLGGGPGIKTKMGDAERRAFADRMKGRVLAIKQGQTTDTDEVPF